MRTFDWFYLCNDPEKLSLMLSKLPRLEGLRRLLVICNARNAHMIDDFHAVFSTVRHTVAYDQTCLVTDHWVLSTCLNNMLSQRARAAAEKYKLFVKLCAPLYARDGVPLLYTDDDVLVLDQVTPLMGDKLFTTTNLSDRLKYTAKGAVELEAYNAIFGLNLLLEEYNASKSDAGIWSFRWDPEYWTLLNAFFESDFVYDAIMRGPPDTTFQRLWDQKFLTMYFARRGVHVLRSVRHARVYIEQISTMYASIEAWAARGPDAYPIFVHYGTSSFKPAYMDLFQRVIKEGADR